MRTNFQPSTMPPLTIDQPAPPFTAKDQNGNTISLKDFKGKKLAIYFYPKDDTPACTAQACNLRDNYKLLQQKGYEIIGISPDTVKKHKKFEVKYDLPFRLVADEEHRIADAYGIWGLKKFMGREYMGIIRTTFLINAKGKIERIIDKINTKEHTQDILEM